MSKKGTSIKFYSAYTLAKICLSLGIFLILKGRLRYLVPKGLERSEEAITRQMFTAIELYPTV